MEEIRPVIRGDALADPLPAPDAALEAPQARPSARQFSILRREGAWRDALRRRMLAGADVIAVASGAVVLSLSTPGVSLLLALGLAPLWLVLAKLYGLYDNDHRSLRHLTVDELPSTIAWVTTATATHVLAASMLGGTVDSAAGIALWATVLTLAPCLRAGARGTWRRLVPPERAVLVGSGPLEAATHRKLELFSDIHVRCVGVIDDHEFAPGPDGEEAHVLQLRLARHADADRVIVASAHVSEPLIAELVSFCRRAGLKLSVVPPARGMFGTAVQLHHIADLPMIEYSTWDIARSTMLLKRALDLVASALALIVLSPLLLVIAAAIRIDSRGGALFVQARAGVGGRPFRMFKFRTMTADAEGRLGEVVDLGNLEDPMFKLQRDPRVTSVGRWLRRTSVDELPQLINVLRGEMSLVGPRPEEVGVVALYSPAHRFRLAVKPGVTGPMQVFGRGELRFDERLAVEREYVENLSLRRDLRILLLTIATVFRGRGAF